MGSDQRSRVQVWSGPADPEVKLVQFRERLLALSPAKRQLTSQCVNLFSFPNRLWDLVRAQAGDVFERPAARPNCQIPGGHRQGRSQRAEQGESGLNGSGKAPDSGRASLEPMRRTTAAVGRSA